MGIKGDKKEIGLILSGQPLLVKEANIYLTQPKIKDIVLFGEDDFFTAIQMLIDINKFADFVKKGNSELGLISDFQLLLIMIAQDETVSQLLFNLFELIFPDYQIQLEENSIDFFVNQEDLKILVGRIHPFNFEYLQTVLSDAFVPQGPDDEPDYNPINDAAREIAEKIKKGREKVKAQKGEVEGDKSLFAQYTSILSVGMRVDINIFYNYTPFQLFDSFKRFFSKESSDYFMRLQSMPMMDTSKIDPPPDWARNLY